MYNIFLFYFLPALYGNNDDNNDTMVIQTYGYVCKNVVGRWCWDADCDARQDSDFQPEFSVSILFAAKFDVL